MSPSASLSPSISPSQSPSLSPSISPSGSPSISPSPSPSFSPSPSPSAAPSGDPPAYIQSAISPDPSSASGTSIQVAYSTQNLTAGSVLWCYCNWYGTNVAPSCSDGTNGSWTAGPEAYNAGETRGMAMFYFVNTAGGVTPTVTVSWGCYVHAV